MNKKTVKYLLYSLVVAFLCISCNTSQYKEMQVSLPDITAKTNGTYRGEVNFKGTPINVIVDVVLNEHLITAIDIIKHTCSPIGKRAEVIIDRIIETQSFDVDVVSGATVSSKAILKAVEEALR
ncbi:MAG: FMN-binding protein [Treponema sp.]|nr:FMN-binding protein [Treponema sp.]